MKLIYLNANIIYGECLKLVAKKNWKRNIKTGVIQKLLDKDYKLFTSILTKTEVLQRLIREENCSIHSARKYFSEIMNQSTYIL